MSAYSRSDIENSVSELGAEQPWNHAIELPHGVWTTEKKQSSHGKNLVKWERIKPLIDEIGLEGKRVLDIGCNEGYFSIQMHKAGAKSGLGFDISDLRLKKAHFVAEVLNIGDIEYKQIDIYDGSLLKEDRFDFALCMGFLHRIPNVYGAIDVISDVTDMVLFEWKAYRGCSSHLPVMLYDGVQSLDYDPHSMAYFRPSIQCLMHILNKKGFSHHYIVDDPSQGRVIMISSVKDHALFQGRSVMSKISKFGLLYKYSRHFAGSIRDIFTGKIQV